MNETAGAPPLHGTLVSHNGVGCLLLGAPGTGKSRLGVEIMAFGGRVVADDLVVLRLMSGMLMGGPPKELMGIVEMRGVGLNKIPDTVSQHVVHMVIELNTDLNIPVPTSNTREFEGVELPYFVLPPHPYTSALYVAAVMRAVLDKRILPPDWKPGV